MVVQKINKNKKKTLSVAGIKRAAERQFASVEVEGELEDGTEVTLEFRQIIRLDEDERQEWMDLTNETIELVEEGEDGEERVKDGQKVTVDRLRRQMAILATDDTREDVEAVLSALKDHEVVAFYGAVLSGVVDEGE